MTRILKAAMLAALALVGTSAFADTYPLLPPPDLFLDGFSSPVPSTVAGTVESITDTGLCSAFPCYSSDLNFWDILGVGFEVYQGAIPGTNVVLEGTEVAEKWGAGGQFGQVFKITLDDNAFFSSSSVEGQPASSFGTFVAVDFNNVGAGWDFSAATADLAPTPARFAVTPEPATMTLALSGLAAGVLRRKWAKRKANA